MHTGIVVLLKEEARHLVSDGARDRVASGFRGTHRHSGPAAMRSLPFELSG
jgi:hypothetical protein